MADEVIIEEYAALAVPHPNNTFSVVPGALITTQVLDIAVASAQFNKGTKFIRVQSNATALWFILGGSSPDAAANTDGNRFIPAGQYRDVSIVPGVDLKIDTAADA